MFTVWFYGEGFLPMWTFACIIGVFVCKYRNLFAGIVAINIIIMIPCTIGLIDKYIIKYIN